MAYLNKVMLIGKVGKDPEIKMFGNTKKAFFSLATSVSYKDESGEKREITTWHNIICWGKMSDIVEMLHIKKGASVYVDGSISNRSYEDASGNKKSITEIPVSVLQVLGNPKKEPEKNVIELKNDVQKKNPIKKEEQEICESYFDDDMPF